ncbi:helix-turn-helix domain-containing protein [Bradyrhizobium liaoningense]
MTTLRDDLVQRLEHENDELRERIRVLEELVGIRIDVPLVFGLTAHEAVLFGLLLRRDLVTKEMAMVGLYGDRPDLDPEIKIVDVYVCKARKKLKRFGVEIETVWGRGYRLSAESKAIAQGFLDHVRAA